MRISLLLAAVALLLVPSSALAYTPQDQRYVVQFAEGTSAGQGAQEVRGRGGRVERSLTHVFPGAVARMSPQAAAALARNPRVVRVEIDAPVRALDTQGSPPWGLDRVDQVSLPLTGSYAWTASGARVTAYVVDSGIRADHVDLAGRVEAGATAISDGNGTGDCNGHGTHVAGTLGGSTYGVAKSVRLMPVRVLDCDGSGTLSGVISGLDWIVAQHVAGAPAVANLSLGGAASSTLDAAVQALVDDGISVAVAAGNSNVDACGVSPARVPAALTVAATDAADARAAFSNYGSCIDLFAPGVGVLSAWYTSATDSRTISGTSMASPHLAGAAAALLEVDPTLTPAAVAERLTSTASTGRITGAGVGSPDRLLWANPALGSGTDPAASVPDTTAPQVAITEGPGPITRSSSTSVSFTGTDPDRPDAALTYHCQLDGAAATTCTSPVTYNALADGMHTLQVVVLDEAGNRSEPASSSWRVDTAAPTITAGTTPKITLGTSVTLSYSGADVGGSGVKSYDVRHRSAPYNGGFGSYVYPDDASRDWTATTATSVKLPVTAGRTYCLSARSRDAAGNTSSWTAERCTTVALDDRALSGTGWGQVAWSGYYKGSASTATSAGAVLARSGVQTRRISLIATTCSTCGSVGVYWNGTLLKQVSLVSSTTYNKRIVGVADLGSVKTGTVTIRTVQNARSTIDGVALRPR